MRTNKQNIFFGTIFNKDVVVQISRIAKLFGWIIFLFYATQWLLQLGVFFSQVSRGFWIGLGFMDIAQNIYWLLEQPIRGLVYFVVLQGVAQVLLMILEIENNTRITGKSI